jgi:hypothetical protein
VRTPVPAGSTPETPGTREAMERRGDPMNREPGDDDAGGMPGEFVDTPANEPGDQDEPTVTDRVAQQREPDDRG